MAARTKRPRRAPHSDIIRRSIEPLAFLPEQPLTFAYVEDEDEFEIPQIPTQLARSGKQLRLAAAFQPASSFDLIAN